MTKKIKAAPGDKTGAAFQNLLRLKFSMICCDLCGGHLRPLRLSNYGCNPRCGKVAAIAMYCFGILPLESVARISARHPEWAAA
jgi:hypothetical protein